MPSPEPYEQRTALGTTVRAVHCDAAAACMRSLGYDFPHWDSEVFDRLPLGIEGEDQGFGSSSWLDFWTVAFDSRQLHPGIILAHSHFRLRRLKTPLSYSDRITDEEHDHHAVYVRKLIDSPVHALELDLWRPTPEPRESRGTVFITPDSPPVAIHNDDIQYVRKLSALEPDDPRIISACEKSFGPESLHFLDEAVCGALIRALRITPCHIPNIYDHS